MTSELKKELIAQIALDSNDEELNELVNLIYRFRTKKEPQKYNLNYMLSNQLVTDKNIKLEQTLSIDKTAIKKAIKEGETVKGAYLQTNQNLSIK